MSVNEERAPLLSEASDGGEVEVRLSGCGATAACDPRRAYHRYFVLFVMCFLSFGETSSVTVLSLLNLNLCTWDLVFLCSHLPELFA